MSKQHGQKHMNYFGHDNVQLDTTTLLSFSFTLYFDVKQFVAFAMFELRFLLRLKVTEQ